MNIKEAIEILKSDAKWNGNEKVLKVVLAELEKKDRIINKMAEQLTTDIHSKEWVIDYYEREVEK